MASNVNLDISFDYMSDGIGIREKAREVNYMKAYVTNDETAR
jgi:hypothetical protein